MKKIRLSCFEGFKCKADKCRDNCCIGWEIDIDQATLEKYKKYEGPLKERFEKCIDYGENPHFILGENERCPFLNKDGLCDIILDSGEEMLCEICDKHPRFYEWLPGMTFEGYGIGCEKASEMLLNYDKRICFTETEIKDSDEENMPDDKCEIVLGVLKTAADIIQSKNYTKERRFSLRLALLLAFASSVQNAVEAEEYGMIREIIALYSDSEYLDKQVISLGRYASTSWHRSHHQLVDLFKSLESLDERWHKHLDLLYDFLDVVIDHESERDYDLIWENMAIYFLFRYLPGAYFDDDFLARTKLVISFWLTHGLLLRTYIFENLPELAAMFSREIEYSDENVDILLDSAYTEECLSLENMLSMLMHLIRI